MSILFTAKTTQQIDTVIAQGIDINTQDYSGETFLHKLVKTHQVDLLDHFLTYKPNTNIKNTSCKTAIFYSQDEDTVKKLILNGAKPNIEFGRKSWIKNIHCRNYISKIIKPRN